MCAQAVNFGEGSGDIELRTGGERAGLSLAGLGRHFGGSSAAWPGGTGVLGWALPPSCFILCAQISHRHAGERGLCVLLERFETWGG